MSRLDLLIEYVCSNCPECSAFPWNAPHNDYKVLPVLESMRSGDSAPVGEGRACCEAIVAGTGRWPPREVQAEMAKSGAPQTSDATDCARERTPPQAARRLPRVGTFPRMYQCQIVVSPPPPAVPSGGGTA
jgi:hypothetical protein